MDMISQIEMEDGVAAYSKLRDRVEEVGRAVAQMRHVFRGVEPERWDLHLWEIRLEGESRRGMEHLNDATVRVKFSTAWENRPDAPEDEHRGEEAAYGGPDEYLTREIKFPRRYLLSEDWLDEEIENSQRLADIATIIRAEQCEARVKRLTEELEKAHEELEAYKREIVKVNERGLQAKKLASLA